MVHEHIARFCSLEHAAPRTHKHMFTNIRIYSTVACEHCEHASNMPSNMRTYVHTNTFLRTCRNAVFRDTTIASMKVFWKPFGINSPAHRCTSKYTGRDHGGGKNFEPAKPACEHGSNMVQTCFEHAVKHNGNTIAQTWRSRTLDSSARIHFLMNNRHMLHKA